MDKNEDEGKSHQECQDDNYRKHQLLERFLVDVLNLETDKAHEEARKISEVMSDETITGIDHLLQHPVFCPDGNIIPGEEKHPRDITTICEMKQGATGRIVQLGYGLGQKHHLVSVGLREGKNIRIVGKQPRGGPIVVEIDGMDIAIGRRMAARVLVKVSE
ncbi:MAG: metal-dependent transcriptional regulator [Candidatus Thermoplasmatota archaeon]|nr:metal-dependent transcriptional regulator [Candidatus Thermoplasmatota archaeon]